MHRCDRGAGKEALDPLQEDRIRRLLLLLKVPER